MVEHSEHRNCGPWNPGLSSDIPVNFLTLSTMFREDNVSTTLREANEFSDFCGLLPFELVKFRVERLIIHELLIRIMADIEVSDGTHYQDLGVNFRQITSKVLSGYICPHLPELRENFEQLERKTSKIIQREINQFFQPLQITSNRPKKLTERLFGARKNTPQLNEYMLHQLEIDKISEWKIRVQNVSDELDIACYEGLSKLFTAIHTKRGRIVGDKQLLQKIAQTLICNHYGSIFVGRKIEPYIAIAIEMEGYRKLPRQENPIVMNVKGASAAGKSTMRPLQKSLARRLNLPWQDFAIISPDIWRKFLLDYDTLGDAYKYAGALSGHELEIVDHKLDRYMANKAAKGNMSHLLIDRFRFDSFRPESEGDDASKLLTRFGKLVYLYFVITPPEATVERAWKRGLEFGRYKAVDDLLDHNVEAYTGMPDLFFTWVSRRNKRVHYEFLDNSVSESRRPRTIAFGWNTELNILDVEKMIDIDRYKKIDIDAKSPSKVYLEIAKEPNENTDFLRNCVKMFPIVNFVKFETGQVYARIKNGTWVYRYDKIFNQIIESLKCKAGFDAIGFADRNFDNQHPNEPETILPKDCHTLGEWGRG